LPLFSQKDGERVAIIHFINRPKSQNAKGLAFVLRYTTQDAKTVYGEQKFVTGVNCTPASAATEFQNTKRLFHKTDGRQYYHFIQSFAVGEDISPATAHEIALRLGSESEKLKGFEMVISTHCGRNHIHSHFVMNSVSAETGKKFHISQSDIEQLMSLSDKLCVKYGLSVLTPASEKKSDSLTDREYRSAVKGQSWKLQLMAVIDDCMARARSKRHFIEMIEAEGYQVRWTTERKSITYTTPSGMRCRDDRLHEEKYLKRRMENEFRIRAALLTGGIEAEELSAAYALTMDSSAPANAEHPTEFSGADQHAEPAGLSFGFHSDSGTDGENPGRTATAPAELTGWEREREILFSSETALAEGPLQPVALSDPHIAGGILGDVLELGYAVEKSFPDVPIKDSSTLPQRIDSAERRKTREKKLALGQKLDDQAVTHEQQM